MDQLDGAMRIASLMGRASDIHLSLAVGAEGSLRISQCGRLLLSADGPALAERFLAEKERAIRFAGEAKKRIRRIAALH